MATFPSSTADPKSPQIRARVVKLPSYYPGEAVPRPAKSMVNILPLSSNEISSPGSGF